MAQVIGLEDIARMADIVSRIDPDEYNDAATKALIYKCQEVIVRNGSTFRINARVVLR